jgi:hypothetical protein
MSQSSSSGFHNFRHVIRPKGRISLPQVESRSFPPSSVRMTCSRKLRLRDESMTLTGYPVSFTYIVTCTLDTHRSRPDEPSFERGVWLARTFPHSEVALRLTSRIWWTLRPTGLCSTATMCVKNTRSAKIRYILRICVLRLTQAHSSQTIS